LLQIFCSQRERSIFDDWNRLPEDVVNASSIGVFKDKIDKMDDEKWTFKHTSQSIAVNK